MTTQTRSRHLVSLRQIHVFMVSILLLASAAGVTGCEKSTSQVDTPGFARKADVAKDAVKGKGHGEVEAEVAPQSFGPPRNASLAPTRIVAYYFHGTTRCQTCLDIERIARETVHESFFWDMTEGRLEWRAVNYEVPSNAALCADFNLPHPSMILASEASGITTDWKLLDQTWKLVSAPDEFRSYVKSEIEPLLATLSPSDPYSGTMLSQ